MFQELGKLKDAERLLKERKFGDVLSLVRDPAIKEHKRAHDAREAARQGLLDEARADLDAGRIQAAGRKVRQALDDGADPQATELEAAIRSAAAHAESEAKAVQRALREARWHDDHGDRGRARRLLEPFTTPDAASFVRHLDETERAERIASDGIVAALDGGTSPDGLRASLREIRQSVKDPKILGDVHGLALDAAAKRRDPAELAALVRDTRGAGVEAGESFERAAEALVLAARSRLEAGADPSVVAEFLLVFPAGSRADAEGSRLKLACWAQGRARAMAARGHDKLAAQLLSEAAAGMPAGAATFREEELGQMARKITGILSEVEDLVASGEWEKARRLLEESARAEPEALVLHDWSDALDAGAAELEALLSEARAAVAAGDLRKARRAAMKLRLRGSRSADLAALMDDIVRREEDAQKTALDAERQMVRRGGVSSAPAAASRFEPMPDFSPSPSLVLPGDPFILRVENEGDWLVHPGKRLTIGNQANGEADLQVLAALGAKHAALERTIAPDGTASWKIVAGPGQRVLKNGKPVTEAGLENGDRIQLGHALTLTFHRPIPGNATAAIRLHGDFSIQGCTRLVLFSETGRKGSILLAPGSDGHVPLRSVEARLEIFRAESGDEAGELLARSPQGVAAGDAPERAQVRVRAAQIVAVGALRVHVDAVRK